MPHQRHTGEGDDNQKRPAIVSDKQLKDFDEMLKSDVHEGGWAGPQGEIDYRFVLFNVLLFYYSSITFLNKLSVFTNYSDLFICIFN